MWWMKMKGWMNRPRGPRPEPNRVVLKVVELSAVEVRRRLAGRGVRDQVVSAVLQLVRDLEEEGRIDWRGQAGMPPERWAFYEGQQAMAQAVREELARLASAPGEVTE
jgi:hypothetical protein